jgi:hypothetical protein
MLGADPAIVSVGEVRYLLEEEHGKRRRCACGQLVADCSFWGEVLRRWIPSLPSAGDRTYRRLRNRYERFLGIPWLAFDLCFRRGNLARYRRATRALFEAIKDVSQAAIIADSSKTPARVLMLRKEGLADLRLVHMVRDPRAVVWSRVKAHERERGKAMGPARQAAFAFRRVVQWLAVNALAESLLGIGDRGIRVLYEDMVNEPARVLRQIGEVAGVDLGSVGERAAAGGTFDFGHIVGGNPRRFKGPARLEMDTEWTNASPSWMRWMVWVVAGPQARRYGYRR